MRNLKRALSLTLASVMLLGMMVVGAGAAGFPDVADDNDNVEAIEVLQAIEVMVGNADTGNFEPDRSVTRTEMAVVMANLLKLDYKYYEASCDFWDVPTWARPYVGACYANKIVSGYGDGTYGALDPITPVQAASMMMRALGYFQYSEDYKDGFETATVRQGTQIGIFEGIGSSADKDMTRGQVARMALNALESEMVTFTGTPGTTYTTSTGESITVGYVAKYEPRTSTELKYKAIEDRTSDASLDSNHRGQYYIQLGEELYDGKLVKSYDRDVFMRPSINWQYKGAEIGTYVDYELKKAEYLTGVKYSKLYGDLTYTTINNNDIDRYVDGALQADETKDNFYRANDETVKGTGTGALTEVFLDERNDLITITTINTYLAQANSDYNKTSESLSLKVFDKRGGTTKVVDADVVPQVVNVQKDDYKLVYMSFKDRANGEVVSMYDVEIMAEAEISKFSIDGSGTYDKVVKKLTTGGTEYDTNVKAYYDGGNVLDEYNSQLLSDMSYNIYMDRYDNVIGVDLHEGAKNYVFITGYDRGISHISTKTADAAAIFTDGTMDVITVNVTDTNKNIDGLRTGSESKSYDQYDVWSGDGKIAENRWYTYTVNASGTYTLRPVKNFMFSAFDDAGITYGDTIRTLNTANLFLKDGAPSSVSYDNKGNIYGNDDSIYLTVEAGRVDKSKPEDDIIETNPGVPGEKVNDAIVDIVGRYTGAQDVKIDLKADVKQEVNEAKKTAEKDAYVYSIFDNNYYVIASVVLGEAQGAAANYVYVLDGVQNERVEHGKDAKSASDDTYYWEFKAVVDGEETTLTVKEKYDNTLNSLKNILKVHTIQEIRFDGEYVTAIKDVALKDTFTNPSSEQTLEDMKIYDIGNEYGQTWTVNNADGNGFVHNNSYGRPNTALDTSDPNAGLYNGVRVEGNRIEVVGRTLYTNRDRGDVGLALANNAKAVVVQPVNGSIKVTNCGSVSEAVGMLADRYPRSSDKEFKGRVAAALDSAGAAKWVVIISDTNLVTGDRPNYDYDGKTYTLTLRDCLSNWNVTNYDRAHVFMRANNSSNWEPVDAKGTGVYSDVYEILSGYQVRVTDRDIDANGKIAGSLANSAETPISISEYISRNEIQFIMPSANVELKENIAYTYTITSFEIKLNQPIKEGALDLTKIEIIPHATKVAKAADPEIPGLVLKAKTAVGEITGGKLVATVTWDAPADGFNTYEVASTYTATVSDDKGNVQTTEDIPNTSLSAQADTAVLAGPVVVVATTDENGKVTAFNVTDLNKAEADGFLVVNSEDEKLGEGTVATEGDKTTITAELGENATEGDTITINGDEVTVGKDGQVSTETEPVDPAEAIKAVVMTAVPADEVAAEADLTATTSTAGVTVAVAPAKAPAEAGECEVVITVSTENEKGFAVDVAVTGAEGWAVSAVTEGAKSFTLTKTITVTADPEKPVETDLPKATEADGTITLPYYKDAPTADQVKAKIQADIPDLKVVSVMGKAPTYTAYDAEQNPYTITLEEQIRVTLNGENGDILGYVKKSTAGTVAAPDETKMYIIPATGKAYAADVANKAKPEEISIASSTADVIVYEAVKFDGTGGIALANLKVLEKGSDGITTTLAALTSNPYVKVGETVYVTAAAAHTGEYTGLTMNDVTVSGVSVKDVAANATLYQYTTATADMKDGKIVFAEVVGKKVEILDKTGNKTEVGVVASAGTLTLDKSFASSGTTADLYVPVTETTAWESAANKNTVVELKWTVDDEGNTVTTGSLKADVYAKGVDGIITLVPAALVKLAAADDITTVKAAYGEIAATTVAVDNTSGFYMAVGSKLELTSKDSDLTEGQFIGVTIGDAEEAVEVDESVPAADASTAATGEYTISGVKDLVFSLEDAPVAAP